MIIPASVDAHVRENQPAANFGSSTGLRLDGGSGSTDRFSYIHFARPFPLGATILSATLRVYLAKAWAGTNTVTANRIIAAWQEARINWNNRPAVSATHTPNSVISDGVAGDVVEIDLTAMMQAVADGGVWYGVRLILTQDQERVLWSSEAPNPNLRPTLDIEWSEAPNAPDRLAPAGGRAVSVDLPLLTWRFSDRLGDTQQASSQVQISTSEDFTTPEYDSTKVANTESQWDLAATAYAGLAADDVRFWRVKVWDGTDLESDWSDPVEFTRKTHGSLTLVSPGATVDEKTPPVVWTFADRTQEAWELTLFLISPTGSITLIHRVPRHPATDVEYTLPSPSSLQRVRLFSQPGSTFLVQLRVWDTLDRQASATDPDYVEVEQEFEYERDGGPAAVTAITAAAGDLGDPSVLLTWERTTVPDYFAVVVDGVGVIDRLEAADVLLTAGSPNVFQYRYWGATPRVASTYEVEAVVQSLPGDPFLHSDGNATVAFTSKPMGIWLFDEDDDTAVMLASKEPANLALGETGTTHYLIGKPAPVRLTDVLRGYEGEVSGTLLSAADRDILLELKGRLKTLGLVVGDLNLPVFLEEVSAVPTPTPDDVVYTASVKFFQVDEFPL